MKKIALFSFTALVMSIICIGCHETLTDRGDMESPKQEPSLEFNYSNKKKEKCVVCHYQKGEDAYKKLEVPCGNALNAHLNHGDSQVGDVVPNQEEYVFGDNCELVELIAACPCFDAAALTAVMSGRIGFCNSSDIAGFLARSGMAMQSMVENYCKYNFGSPITTSNAEKNGCVQLILDAVAAYAADNPPDFVNEDLSVCSSL